MQSNFITLYANLVINSITNNTDLVSLGFMINFNVDMDITKLFGLTFAHLCQCTDDGII